ncbi:uncharacterized protein LOC129298672 [Prosopis cineraria]|uniref:uncharacterized protein LOC129298672 n=1 Tax=Prosopis cineraria TaxID=364024 RepID=UPI0024105C2B|nr:uncharacterized protein LOC129298672 [Prosopis cineraria]
MYQPSHKAKLRACNACLFLIFRDYQSVNGSIGAPDSDANRILYRVIRLLAVQNSKALVKVDLNETTIDVNNDVQNGGFFTGRVHHPAFSETSR